MKTRIINRLASLCVLSMWLGTGFVGLASGQQACCLTLPAPPGNAISVDLTGFQSPDHFFDVQVSSAPAAIPPGHYNGWCVEEQVDILVGTTVPDPYSGQVFSSCDPSINTYLAAEPGALNGDWPAVNYILNHKALYYSEGFTWSDVQAAIWYFVGSGQPPVPLPYPVGPGPSVVPDPFVPNQVNVNLILLDVAANKTAWVTAGHPKCGDKTAAVLLFDGLPNPLGTPDVQLLMIEVPCPCPPTLTCQGGSGQVNQPFTSQQLMASGGTPPYTYSIISGSLPDGLTLNAGTGIISGTPTKAGTFSFTAQVTDNNGLKATSTCTSGCTPSPCTTTWDFSNPSGCLNKSSQAYTAGGLTITAYGFTYVDGGQPALNLYGKSAGPDETGLGLCVDKDYEIGVANFIQLDMSDLIAKGITSATLWIRSVQRGEGFYVYQSAKLGTRNQNASDLLKSGTIADGNKPFQVPLSPSSPFISVQASAANVLLGAVSVSCAGACTITIAPPPPPSCITRICGSVVIDCNPAGNFTGDPGLGGVTVLLKTKSGAIVATTTTDSTGAYCFTPSAGGTYIVSIVVPANYKLTTGNIILCWKDSSGNDCWLDNKGNSHWRDSSGIHHWMCQDGSEYFRDTDGKNYCKNWNGKNRLSDRECDNDDVDDSAGKTCSRDSSGNIHWTDARGRDCWKGADGIVHRKDTDGNECWKDNSGSRHWVDCKGKHHWKDSSGKRFCDSGAEDDTAEEECGSSTGLSSDREVCVVACQSKLGVIFAVCPLPTCTGSICGTVVKDRNCDGNLAGDPCIAGVTVKLKNASGTVVATKTTDTYGNYCFSGLAKGTYTVVITPPANCQQTKGCTTSSWTDNYGRACWADWDKLVHWRENDGTHCWLDKNSQMHWKDLNGNCHRHGSDGKLYDDTGSDETCRDSDGQNNERQVCLQACENKNLDSFGYCNNQNGNNQNGNNQNGNNQNGNNQNGNNQNGSGGGHH